MPSLLTKKIAKFTDDRGRQFSSEDQHQWLSLWKYMLFLLAAQMIDEVLSALIKDRKLTKELKAELKSQRKELKTHQLIYKQNKEIFLEKHVPYRRVIEGYKRYENDFTTACLENNEFKLNNLSNSWVKNVGLMQRYHVPNLMLIEMYKTNFYESGSLEACVKKLEKKRASAEQYKVPAELRFSDDLIMLPMSHSGLGYSFGLISKIGGVKVARGFHRSSYYSINKFHWAIVDGKTLEKIFEVRSKKLFSDPFKSLFTRHQTKNSKLTSKKKPHRKKSSKPKSNEDLNTSAKSALNL